MFTKINFRISYLGILVDMKYKNKWLESLGLVKKNWTYEFLGVILE